MKYSSGYPPVFMCCHLVHPSAIARPTVTLDPGETNCTYSTTIADSGLDTAVCPGNVRADEGLNFPRLYVEAVCDCNGGIPTGPGSIYGSPGSCQCPCLNAAKVASVPLQISATVFTLNAEFQEMSKEWNFEPTAYPDTLPEQIVALSATFSAS